MRTIERSSAFKRDFKRAKAAPRHRNDLDSLLSTVVARLASDQVLLKKNRDHGLSGDWAGYRECHIKPDLLLIYSKPGADTLRLARLGSHSELFGGSAPPCGFSDWIQVEGPMALEEKIMPVVDYYSQKEPAADAVIWRFMDLRKFRDLMASEELYFRRADLFDDETEGLPPEQYVQRVPGLDPWDVHDRTKLNNHLGSLAQSREMHYLTCWHLLRSETLAMWEASGHDGVATRCCGYL